MNRKIFYTIFKRLCDLILSLLLVPFLLLLLLVVKILYILNHDYKPIIFKQIRTGKNGKKFTLYKFRTMVYGNDVYDLTNKDKMTKIGSFLRKNSLDELLQILNILKGEMSFIGPRPWIVEYYENMNSKQRQRYNVLPGITGLAQAMGRNNISIFEKIKYDLEYVENISLKQDIKILLLTIKAVIYKEGVEAGKCTIQEEIMYLKEHNNEAIN